MCRNTASGMVPSRHSCEQFKIAYQGCIQGVAKWGICPTWYMVSPPSRLRSSCLQVLFLLPKACKKGDVMLKVTNKIVVIQNSTEKARGLPTNLELPV